MLLARSMQNTRRSIDAKAENDALRDDAAAGRQSVAHQSSLPPREVQITASGVIMQPPDWQTPLNGNYFTLRERLITMQKQLEGTQKYINEQCR